MPEKKEVEKLLSIAKAVSKIKTQKRGRKIKIMFEKRVFIGMKEIKELSDELVNVSGDVSLDLSKKSIGFEEVKYLFSTIQYICEDVTVDLSYNDLSDIEAAFIAMAVKGKKEGRLEVRLRGNLISETGVILLADAIEKTECSWVTLDLRCNGKMTPKSASALGKVLELKKTSAAVLLSYEMIEEQKVMDEICASKDRAFENKEFSPFEIYINGGNTRMSFDREYDSPEEGCSESEGEDEEESASTNNIVKTASEEKSNNGEEEDATTDDSDSDDDDEDSDSSNNNRKNTDDDDNNDDVGRSEKVEKSESEQSKNIFYSDEILPLSLDIQYFQKEKNETKEEKERAEHIEEISSGSYKLASVEMQINAATPEEFEVAPQKIDMPSADILGLASPISV